MLNQAGGEPRAESVDIKEYLAVLLKRKWLVLVCFLLSMAGTTAFLFTRQPIYRASGKMLITYAGGSMPITEITREDEGRFFSTQIDIMLSQTMLRRVQQRMKKTPEEVRENLVDLKITAVRGAAIMLISVDSPSKDFARDFANTMADEYLKFREEQRAASSESALLLLTREINRLGQELKTANDRLLTYAKEHGMLSDLSGQGSTWMRRYSWNAMALGNIGGQLSEMRARKQLLDSRPEASTVLALLAAEGAAATPEKSAVNPASMPIKEGAILSIVVDGNTNLTTRAVVSGEGIVDYKPLGPIVAKGLSPLDLAVKIQDALEAAHLLKPVSGGTAGANLMTAVHVTVEGNFGGVPDNPPALAPVANPGDGPAEVTRGTLAALPEGTAYRMFDLDRRRRIAQVRVNELRKVYRSKHPALIAAEQDLVNITTDIDNAVQFYRQKTEADLQVVQQKYTELDAAAKKLDAEAITEGSKSLEMKALSEDADRVRGLYNALLGKLMTIDVTQGFNLRSVSILEPAIVDPTPVYPKKTKGLMVAAFFGFGLGLALAFFIEYIDDSIKLAEEVERDLQLPFLGMIPAAQRSPDDLTAHRLDKLKQQGGVAESYRVVRSAVIFAIPREKLRSILLASAVPREGKTTTCVNLGIGFAQIDERVLLLDADLRRGEIHKYFGIEREKGLSDVLLGEATPEEVVKSSGVPKLDVFPCGSYPANPAELLLGWRFKEVLQWAYKHYDRVLIDCPPIMGIADSAILGSAADGVLFVIWAGRTSRRYVRVAKMTAVSRGAKIFGFILNNLEPGRVGYYHYYPYYYSYYSRGYYYTHAEEEADRVEEGPTTTTSTETPDKKETDDVY